MGYPRYTKQRVAVTSDDWTPITPPNPMDYFALRCDGSALTIRTDKDDPLTEDTLPQNGQESVLSGGLSVWNGAYGGDTTVRFHPDTPVCWIKSVQPTATVVVTWVV